MTEPQKIRILIADDHAVVRSGLHSILEMEGDLVVIAEASDGHQALALAQEMLPDIVLMDIKMGDWDGVTATRRIRNSVPSTRVIVLTNHDQDELVFSSIRAGASGYLLKEVTGSQLTNAIRTVADGFSLIYPSVAKRVLDEFGRLRGGDRPAGDDEGYSDLTAREREVLKLVASGRANKEIAATLGISERTVKTHISNIFSKLELTDRTQAALYVHNRGLLEKDPIR
jgi:DNA-binding NarL/FixJ family response regulator